MQRDFILYKLDKETFYELSSLYLLPPKPAPPPAFVEGVDSPPASAEINTLKDNNELRFSWIYYYILLINKDDRLSTSYFRGSLPNPNPN